MKEKALVEMSKLNNTNVYASKLNSFDQAAKSCFNYSNWYDDVLGNIVVGCFRNLPLFIINH